MSYEPSKTENALIDLLKTRGVDEHSSVGIMLLLKNDSEYKKMIRWIRKNPYAGQYEILGELDVFKKHASAQQNSAPRRIKRIAMF